MLDLAGILVCAVVIFFSGQQLSAIGEKLAVQSGLGQIWMGIILLSAITSLPELMVGISATSFVGSADLAVGDILGSCSFNLFLLAMLDVFVPRNHTLFGNVSSHHIIAASLGIVLMAIFTLVQSIPIPIHPVPWVGYPSILFLIIYFMGVRLTHGNGRAEEHIKPKSGQESSGNHVERKWVIQFSGFSLLIVLPALLLPFFLQRLSNMVGMSESFAGTFILAASTSLPETAVSLAAVRKGALDLAVGNLLGSNLFNFFILAMDDLVYPGADLLRDATSYHQISAVGSIMMSAIAIIGISAHSKGKRFLMAWDAIVISFIYIIMLVLLFHFTR
jgi:cation:H+ antiporter